MQNLNKEIEMWTDQDYSQENYIRYNQKLKIIKCLQRFGLAETGT